MGALKVQQQMALDKFEAMSIVDRRRVLFHLDDIARAKGFMNEADMRAKKLYLWNQMCADTVNRLFP